MARYVPRSTQRARKQLSEHLVTWRKLQRLTSAQVAERAGIARATYSRLENGEDISLLAFLEVLRALGIQKDLITALDPYETDMGRLRADEQLPIRVRS